MIPKLPWCRAFANEQFSTTALLHYELVHCFALQAQVFEENDHEPQGRRQMCDGPGDGLEMVSTDLHSPE